MGLLGRTVSKTAYVRMVASAHHLGVCALADGLGLIAHIERVSATLLHTHRMLLLCANINVLVYSDRCMASGIRMRSGSSSGCGGQHTVLHTELRKLV